MSSAMAGSVLPDGQSVISIRVRGPQGQIAQVQAVVDTGFNDFLTLPPWAIQRLELALGEEIRYALADGSQAETRQYLAEIEWFGAWRRIFVAEVDNNALLGTEMMRGSLLTIEMVNGGRVEIRPIGG